MSLAGKKIVMPIPVLGFDPSEAAIPWQILTAAGATVICATPDGGDTVARADPLMVTGTGLWIFKFILRAEADGRAAYKAMEASGVLGRTVSYASLKVGDYDAALLPGGHCPDMRPYIDDKTRQKFVLDFTAGGKPIASVCHGVLLAARAGALKGRAVTSLPRWMEVSVHWSTWPLLGNYYRTYPGETVQGEVELAAAEFRRGPLSLAKDSATDDRSGFVVVDGNVITARWPGDAHRLGNELVRQIRDASA